MSRLPLDKRLMLQILVWMGLIVMLMGGSGCTKSGPPWAHWMEDGPPKKEGVTYPPMYVKGWQDGCHTGISANTNLYYRFFYDFKQDASLVMNDIYYRGWKDAFDYCQRYTVAYYGRKFL